VKPAGPFFVGCARNSAALASPTNALARLALPQKGVWNFGIVALPAVLTQPVEFQTRSRHLFWTKPARVDVAFPVFRGFE
jgi:hypothetical protein